MNTIGVVLSAAAGLVTLTGGSFAVVQLADSRYAPMAALENVEWSLLKRELRELEQDRKENPDDPDIQEDIDALLDRLCRAFPKDRDCKE